MRTLFAIITASGVMLVAFSVPWGIFVVTRHSYGVDSTVSQIGGTLAYFGIYLLLPSMLLALACVWPTDYFMRRRLRSHGRAVGRVVVWALVAGVVYVGAVVSAQSANVLGAIGCAAFASLLAAAVYARIAPSHSERSLNLPETPPKA